MNGDVVVSIPRKNPTRAEIHALASRMAQLPQVENEVTHHFAPHLYARELILRAGTYAIGYVHRTAHMMIMVHGDMEITTGDGMKRFTGYNVLHAGIGAQRVVHVFEDTILISFHPTDTTDVEELEAELVEPETLAIPYPFKALEEVTSCR